MNTQKPGKMRQIPIYEMGSRHRRHIHLKSLRLFIKPIIKPTQITAGTEAVPIIITGANIRTTKARHATVISAPAACGKRTCVATSSRRHAEIYVAIPMPKQQPNQASLLRKNSPGAETNQTKVTAVRMISRAVTGQCGPGGGGGEGL